MELSHMETITRDKERRVMGMDHLMKEIGKMVNGMEKEHIERMVFGMRVIFLMDYITDLDVKHGQTIKKCINTLVIS